MFPVDVASFSTVIKVSVRLDNVAFGASHEENDKITANEITSQMNAAGFGKWHFALAKYWESK